MFAPPLLPLLFAFLFFLLFPPPPSRCVHVSSNLPILGSPGVGGKRVPKSDHTRHLAWKRSWPVVEKIFGSFLVSTVCKTVVLLQGDPTGGGAGSYEGENPCVARAEDSSRQMPDAGAAPNSNTDTRARSGNVTARMQTSHSHSSCNSSGALKSSRSRNLAVGMSSCRL